MREVGFLRLLQIVQCGAGRDESRIQILHAETLQGLSAEMCYEQFIGHIPRIEPVVETRDRNFDAMASEQGIEAVEVAPGQQHFAWGDRLEPVAEGRELMFSREKVARGSIHVGDARLLALKYDRGEEIIMLVIEQFVREGDSRRHDLHHVALDDAFRQPGILELFADGHPVSGSHEFRQIGVERMMRKTCERHFARGAV